jgi:N-methylhydantoinase A
MFRVCVDTGGTFTDSVVMDDKGNLAEFKAPTTPGDFSEGVINALKEAASGYNLSLEQFIKQTDLIVHGTTVATNALITKKVARTAMITTKGFRDIIEMRRSLKIETHSMYDAYIPPYDPIIPRYLRFTVEEKTKYTGEVTKQVNEKELESIIAKLVKEKVEAVAICFINAYANSANEKKAAEICSRSLKDVFITCSSELLPKMGEYERESTSVINACLGPVVNKYMAKLESKLKENGFTGQLLIIQANQYAQSVTALTKKPVYVLDSGPAAGPAGAAFLGSVIGEPNSIVGDMGGTTFDASLIKNGQVSLASGRWFGDDRMGIKVVDVKSIGAGGGSIGWVDALGLLRVGPQSAAADPGPACYSKGGNQPTVTDAAVLLGYIPPDYFWGGKLKLDVEKAKSAMKMIADPLKLSIEKASHAMFQTVNSNMADDITEISTRKGYDVRDFSLVACGGGGALFGAFIADLLGIKKTIVPKFAASFCAWSMFNLDVGRDYLRSYVCTVKKADPSEMNKLYEDMIREAMDEFKVLNVSRADLIIEKSVDVRYQRQFHELEIKLPEGEIIGKDIDTLEKEFHESHKELFTFSLPWVPVDIRNLRLIARVKAKKIEIQKIPAGTSNSSDALKRKRQCFFNSGFIETPIYDGTRLKAGNVIKGQAVIEDPTSTAVIPPGFSCTVDEYGNFIIKRIV